MPKYYVDVMIHGRVGVIVEADNERDAELKAYDHPDVPSVDKLYESDSIVGYEIEED